MECTEDDEDEMFDPNVSYRALSWFEEELRKEREGIVEEEEEPEGWWGGQ